MEIIKYRQKFRQHITINCFAQRRKFFHDPNPMIVHNYISLHPNNFSVVPPLFDQKNLSYVKNETYKSNKFLNDTKYIHKKPEDTYKLSNNPKANENTCEELEVLKICDHHSYKNKRVSFLIHWKNFSAADRTWEYLRSTLSRINC